METINYNSSSPGHSGKRRRHHINGGHHRKTGKRLRKYLLVLNSTLAWYICYAIFFVVMQRYCHSDQKCFLDTNLNHLLLLITAFSFTTHVVVSLIAFIKHRKNKSRRLIAHQIVALSAFIIALMLFLFKGLAVFMEMLANI